MMSKFQQRSTGQEIMDDLSCKGEVVEQTLRELDVINSALGGNDISIDGLSLLLNNRNGGVYKVVDLGCGGGRYAPCFSAMGSQEKKTP